MFDSVTFCLDCHASTSPIQPIASTALGRNLTAINWVTEQHGQLSNPGWVFTQIAPYNGDDFVLSCLDCHEPHGSPNAYLLRQTVNGTQTTNPAISRPYISVTTNRWYYFCIACHAQSTHITGLGPNNNCGGCHSHGSLF
jgi:hypothetical protein